MRRKISSRAVLLLCFMALFASHELWAKSELLGVRFGKYKEKTRVVLDLSGPVKFTHSYDDKNNEVEVSISGLSVAKTIHQPGVGIVTFCTCCEDTEGTARLVLRTKEPATVGKIFTLAKRSKYPDRLVIDIKHEKPRPRQSQSAKIPVPLIKPEEKTQKAPETKVKTKPDIKIEPEFEVRKEQIPNEQAPVLAKAKVLIIPRFEQNTESLIVAKPGMQIATHKLKVSPHTIVVPIPLPLAKLEVSDEGVPERAEQEEPVARKIATVMSLPIPAPAEIIQPAHTVVIDAGHGGIDPGTIGSNGITEKDVVLFVAREIKNLLTHDPLINVILTRDEDNLLRLRERFAIARQARADLFISLHADANHDKRLQGLSVYTLSDKASDLEAEMLARHENKADVIAGVDFNDTSEEVTSVLINLAMKGTVKRSTQMAHMLINSFKTKNMKMVKNHHRSADIAVLKAPDVPSVLIELGYLSNSEDVKRLSRKDYKKRIASRIVEAIKAYFKDI